MKVKQTQQGIPSAFCDDSSQETVAKDQDSVRCLPFHDQKGNGGFYQNDSIHQFHSCILLG